MKVRVIRFTIGFVVGAALAALVLATFTPRSSSADSATPASDPTAATGEVLPLSCTKVRASAWNKLIDREIAADGSSAKHRRKTSVCLRPYNRYKRHVVKVERANCVGQGVTCWIAKAAKQYHQSYSDMLRVATCESGLDPSQNNSGGASGLFQFLPSTWATTPYSRYSIFSAKYSALAAGWMWSVGRRSEWVCQ